jgi:hypothetical protein
LYNRRIQKGKELIRTRIDLLGRVLVISRIGAATHSNKMLVASGENVKLNFGYAVEDIKTHHLQKNHCIWLGRSLGRCSSIWGSRAGHESSA